MATAATEPEQEPSALKFSLANRRTLVDRGLTVLAIGVAAFALFPLFSVLYMLMARGGHLLSPALFSELTPGAGMEGGGIGNALLGTLIVVLVASAFSLPLGIMAAIYLAEYAGESRLGTLVRFAGKVLTGMPSILAGVFAYAVIVVTTKSFSAFAGGVAMAILMVPTIMLTGEQALRAVPEKMRLASLGMGASRMETTLHVVLPTALPGILTGVMLALARAMGETAPLLFTALFSDYWFDGKLGSPIASLSVLIYNFSGSPFAHLSELAWAASLVLVVFVLALNVTAQLIIRRPKEFEGSEEITAMSMDIPMSAPDAAKAPATTRRAAAAAQKDPLVMDCRIRRIYYGQFLAVRDADIPIATNEITAFIGPSGCGKSTVLRCLNRMNDFVPGFRLEGSVHFRGQDIYADSVDPVAVRRSIGMVFQQPNPFATSIYNNVAFGLKLNRFKGDYAERVEQALRGAALWDEVKDKLHTSGLALSGGQQQRLCIARAIAVEPDLLLMDEPCSALDPIATRRIEELMLELKQRYTIAIVTHNLQQAQRVADRTAFLFVDTTAGGRTGYLIEYRPTQELFGDPREEQTKAYIRGEFS